MTKPIWTKEQASFLEEHYCKYGAQYISTILPFTKGQVYKKASLMRLRVNPEVKKQSLSLATLGKPRPKMCGVNSLLFCPPQQTKEAVYLLGFLWADGYLQNSKCNPYRIVVEITEEDAKNLIPVFAKTGKWCTASRHRPPRKPQSSFICSNLALYKFLESNDYTSKFKSAAKILETIPSALKPYWLRGYFDGDGCISINNKSYLRQVLFSGPHNQDWSFLIEWLNSIGIHCSTAIHKVTKEGYQSSFLRFCGVEQCRRFANYIYAEDDKIGLIRKRIKFDLLPSSKT